MFFKQFIADDLGCASYLIGDTDAGTCVVIDPRWNIADYVSTADEQRMSIAYVIETHNHADHVSGHGKLAALGAQVAIFEGADVEYPHKALGDGESLDVGKVRLTVLHTPGHRPEHIALAVADTTRADVPWIVLTGDSLFVGDVGRPDLAVEPKEGAAQLYRSLHDKLLTLQDGVEIYPAHVSGSLCGKSMSAKGSSTIGFERLFNPPLLEESEAGFFAQVTRDLPPQPPQFARIVAMNRGPFLTDEIVAAPMSADEVETMKRGGALVLDTRSPEAFGGGHVPGALNVDLRGGQFATRASWIIPEGSPVVLVLESTEDLSTVLEAMSMVGQENIVGYMLGGMHGWASSGRLLDTIPQVSAHELHSRDIAGDRFPKGNPVPGVAGNPGFQVLDVREDSEWQEGHIPGAMHIPFHDLLSRLDEVPSNKRVVTICGSGERSSIAASILKAHGFEPVNAIGGMDAWRSDTLPLRESQVS